MGRRSRDDLDPGNGKRVLGGLRAGCYSLASTIVPKWQKHLELGGAFSRKLPAEYYLSRFLVT